MKHDRHDNNWLTLAHSITNRSNTKRNSHLVRCLCAYYQHQHVSVTVASIFRMSLDNNIINILATNTQDVFEAAPSLQSNSVWYRIQENCHRDGGGET